METDSEKLAAMLDEMLAAPKSTNEPCPGLKNHLASVSVQPRPDDPTQIIESDTGEKALVTKTDVVENWPGSINWKPLICH